LKTLVSKKQKVNGNGTKRTHFSPNLGPLIKKITADPISNLKAVILDSENKNKGGKWVLKVGRKIVPFCNESERAIRAIEGEFG
jgi:hypothetical protein